MLNAIYESDFLGFSYGFRPGRNPHNALDALYVGIMRKRVNWMLDADIRGFFDAIDHEWLMKFVEHRIADQRVLRHIKVSGVPSVAPYATAEEPTTPDDRGAHEPFGRPLVSTYSYFAPVPRTATARHDLR